LTPTQQRAVTPREHVDTPHDLYYLKTGQSEKPSSPLRNSRLNPPLEKKEIVLEEMSSSPPRLKEVRE